MYAVYTTDLEVHTWALAQKVSVEVGSLFEFEFSGKRIIALLSFLNPSKTFFAVDPPAVPVDPYAIPAGTGVLDIPPFFPNLPWVEDAPDDLIKDLSDLAPWLTGEQLAEEFFRYANPSGNFEPDPQKKPDWESFRRALENAVPYIDPAPTPTDDEGQLVTYAHVTTVDYANDIMANGIRSIVGSQSGNDPRFFAVTTDRGPEPRPTIDEANEMLADIRNQLFISHPSEPHALVLVKLPQNIVEQLESSGLIHYGPFYPASQFPPFTESIFETLAFPNVNIYKPLWLTVPLN